MKTLITITTLAIIALAIPAMAEQEQTAEESFATVGEVFEKYKGDFVNCSRNKGGCDQPIDIVRAKYIEKTIPVEKFVPVIPPTLKMIYRATAGIVILILLFCGVRIVRPTHRYLVETLGKYTKTLDQGFHWIIPIIQRTVRKNVTEQMVDIYPQTIITKDNLNAMVDGIVYYKIIDPAAAEYNVDDHEYQLQSLARTTLRSVIGTLELSQANENREQINTQIWEVLDKETKDYGVSVLRVELQTIEPPEDVQDAMNEMVKAERVKRAEKDRAEQVRIKAQGSADAAVKEAEGKKQAAILEAEGQAKAFKLIEESFKGNAQLLKQLDVTEKSLKQNSKIIIADKGANLQTIIGNIPTENVRCDCEE